MRDPSIPLESTAATEMSAFTVDRRALGYFKPDARWIALVVVLISVSVRVGLLEA